MKENFITIITSDGDTKQMPVLAAFKLNKANKKCVIYKNVDENKYYAATYKEKRGHYSLNPGFTVREKEEIREIFNTLIKEGTNA